MLKRIVLAFALLAGLAGAAGTVLATAGHARASPPPACWPDCDD